MTEGPEDPVAEDPAAEEPGAEALLPLFPLGTVLVPGLLLPLHVFEPRYRELTTDLLARPEPDRLFGVVAIRQGREVGEDGATALHEVGTAALVRRVDALEDGRFHLVTTGARRFRLLGLADAGTPYLTGRVVWLPEAEGEEPLGYVRPVQQAFTGYLQALGEVRGAEIDLPELPTDPQVLSWLVAATVVVDLADKQALLAAPTTAARLRAELALLRREQALLSRLQSAPAPELTRLPPSPN